MLAVSSQSVSTPGSAVESAFAVAKGKKFDGDPMFADIVDGKLYLFVNDAIFQMYLADKENILRKAEETWPKIRSTAVGDL